MREALLEALGVRYGDALPWLRSTRRPERARSGARAGWRERFKPWLIESLGAHALVAQATSRGHRTNRRLLGVHDFKTDAAGYARLLAGWMQGARDGDLLMCHPSALQAAVDPLSASRCSEYEVLSAPGFAALLGASNVRLAPISRICARAAGEAEAAL